MRCIDDIAESPSLSELMMLHGIAKDSGRWKPAADEPVEVESLSVFGIPGDRYSVMVVSRRELYPGLTGRSGGWWLKDGWREGKTVRFDLQWASSGEDDSSVVLCGREHPETFSSTA